MLEIPRATVCVVWGLRVVGQHSPLSACAFTVAVYGAQVCPRMLTQAAPPPPPSYILPIRYRIVLPL